jgi:hypothetical protein
MRTKINRIKPMKAVVTIRAPAQLPAFPPRKPSYRRKIATAATKPKADNLNARPILTVLRLCICFKSKSGTFTAAVYAKNPSPLSV